MPYVKEDRRYLGANAENAGELNYQFTVLACRYIRTHGLSYEHINAVLGAFEGAKQEFYRRVAVPYEETKMEANGDVYDIG